MAPERTYCVFNQTRESFLGLNVSCAGTPWARLRGLLGTWRIRPGEGVWVVPSQGVHTIGIPYPIDLVYLDAEGRVIHLTEHLRAFRVGPIRLKCASVLEMAPHTIYSSQTRVGDRLLICFPEEMECRLSKVEGVSGER